MNVIKMLFVSFLVVSVLVLGGCGNTTTSQNGDSDAKDEVTNDETYKMDFMIYVGLNDYQGVLFQEFADELREKSEGRLDITVRPTGELPYDATEALNVINSGEVQIADGGTTYINGSLGIVDIYNLPFLLTNQDEFLKAHEVIEPMVNEGLEEYGAEILMMYTWPSQFFWGTGDPVNSYDDLQGLKIRTSATGQQEFVKEVGATPIQMVLDEVPGALQNNAFQALITSGLSVYDNKLYESLDWAYLAPFNIVCNYVVIDSDVKSDLPDDLEGLLEETTAKYQEIIFDEMPNIDSGYIDEMEGELTIINPGISAVEEGMNRMSGYWETWAQDKGPEFEKALEEIRKKLDK